MLLGLLLGKAGVRVLVLEQHRDFSREYRGEVLMPRFTQMMRQIGLFEYLEKYPHLKLSEIEGFYNSRRMVRIGFEEIAPDAPFAIWMPQPILLQAFLDKAKNYSGFEIRFDTRVEDLIREDGKTVGVIASRPEGKTEIRARVTVGTDGRFSIIRKRGGFKVSDEHHRFDIVWFTLPKPQNYDNRARFFLSAGRNCLILPKYPDSIQCGLVVPKDEFGRYVHQGIDSLRQVLLKCTPLFHPFARELKDFSPFNVLQAKIEYVEQWAQGGLLLVGDSAHTCSPAGAIGVSVAVATAIVAADVIWDCFERDDFSAKALGRVQEIREKEVLHLQALQKSFSSLLLPDAKWKQFLTLPLLFVLGQSGLFRFLPRDMLVMKEFLPLKNAALQEPG